MFRALTLFPVTVELKSRAIRVKGPRGTLEREFKHLKLELALVGKKLRVDSWFAKRKVCVVNINT